MHFDVGPANPLSIIGFMGLETIASGYSGCSAWDAGTTGFVPRREPKASGTVSDGIREFEDTRSMASGRDPFCVCRAG